jgi:hypothetical protein
MAASKRGAPNVRVDFITGPSGAPPNSRYATNVAARHVTTSDFVETSEPGILPPAATYLTLTTPMPHTAFAATSGHVRTFDYQFADRVALVTGGPATHFVFRMEVFGLPIAPLYYRVWILPLPAP